MHCIENKKYEDKPGRNWTVKIRIDEERERMQIKIETRKLTDGSGILMMPLRKNVPLPRDPDWKLTICPECGRKCWDRLLPEGYRVEKKLCTECALTEGVKSDT